MANSSNPLGGKRVSCNKGLTWCRTREHSFFFSPYFAAASLSRKGLDIWGWGLGKTPTRTCELSMLNSSSKMRIFSDSKRYCFSIN